MCAAKDLFTETFDGEEFLFRVRDQGHDSHHRALMHNSVCRDIEVVENDKTLHGRPGYLLQECRLARAGLTCKKYRASCAVHISLGNLKDIVFLYAHQRNLVEYYLRYFSQNSWFALRK